MSLRIDESGERALLDSNLPSSTSFTLAFWIYVVNDRTGESRFPFGIEDSLSSSSDWMLAGWEDANDNFDTTTPAGGGEFGSNPPVGSWFYVTISCAGTGNSDFVARWWDDNASSWVSVSISGRDFTPAALPIGANSFGEWQDARYAHVRIWGAVLTESELETEKDATSAQRTTDLITDASLESDATADTGTDLSTEGSPTFDSEMPLSTGTTLTASLAESAIAQDTLQDAATLTVEVADVASAQSTETETLTMRETVSEVGVAADQLTDAQVMVEVLSEAARANDQMVGTLGRVFAAVLTESVSATDTVQSRMTAVETITETVRAADQLNITATLRETLAESAVAADTVTAPVAGVITATLKESVSAGESLETTMTMTAQVREAVRALDRLGLTQTLVTQVIEQAAASDQLQSTLPAEALRFIFDAVRGNQDFDAVDGGTFDAQGRNDFDASGAD